MKYQFKENDYVYTGDVNITNQLKKLAEDNGYKVFKGNLEDAYSNYDYYRILIYDTVNGFIRTCGDITSDTSHNRISIDDFKALVTGKLPKYWIIDCNEKGFEKVIDYVNNKYSTAWKSITSYTYFGVDGSRAHKGTNKSNNINDFKNNPFLLPVEYVLDAIKKSKSLYILNAIRESKSKHEFKIGDKVKIPKTKSRGCDIAESFIIKHANQIKRDYLYIANIFNKTSTNNETYVLSTSLHNIDGDWFSVSDLELCEEPINKEPINKESIVDKSAVKYPIGARVKIIDGGIGSCFMESGTTGTIVDKKDVNFNLYGGEYHTIEAECYIKLDNPVYNYIYAGICKNNGHKLEIIQNMQTITREQLKQIYDIACATWKTKLLDKASKNPLSNNINFTDEEITEMFNAATPKQLELLNTLFNNPTNIIIYNGFECIYKILDNTTIGKQEDLNIVVYARKDDKLAGSIVKEEEGYVLRLRGGEGSNGHHSTRLNCIRASMQFGYKFFIL